MSSHIAPLRHADLPRRQLSFWRLTGPGAILVGLSIGAGEIVLWPWITAKFGAVMVWAAALGVFVQLWVNFEIGRWAIVTGEAPYTGFARIWMGFIYVLLGIGFVGLFLPGWARISGAALKALIFGPDGPGADWVWTAITFASVAVLLFGPKFMYTAVERITVALVAFMTLGLIFVAFQVGTLDAVLEMGRGLVDVGHIELDDEFPFSRFFGAFVFAGAGGAGNLWYAFYLRDKGIGMGARIPKLLNPLRGQEEEDVATGFVYPETDENRRAFRDWFRWVLTDQTLYFWLLNTLTMFLFMFGALCVLRPLGLVPEEGRIIWDESLILGETLGAFGRYLFLVIGMAALYSTQLVGVDGGARAWAYILRTTFRFGDRVDQSKLYLPFALLFMVAGTASTWFFERYEVTGLGFIFNAALLGGFSMAMYVPLMLYMNLRYLPVSARPRALNIVMMLVASALYVGFALYTLWDAIF
ncbi:MAG: Nramp family divalent metal transporter [Myxococcota bacterium]